MLTSLLQFQQTTTTIPVNQNIMKLTTKITVVALSAFAFAAAPAAIADHHKGKKNIVEVAAGNESFKTLVAAVTAADLVEVLSGDGPFTVFAPTDEAFAKLPEGTLESLLKEENKDKLIAILKYHVVAGKVMAKDVKAGEVKTVNGQEATIAINDGKVTIDKATVVKTDVEASNGVIHVIDTVIIPQAS